MLAYDPGYFLNQFEIDHQKTNKPVEVLNFVEYGNLDSYKSDKPFFCYYGEILPEKMFNNQNMIAFISAAMYEYKLPVTEIFYPEHLVMTYKSNNAIDRLRPLTIPNDKPFLADVLMGQPKLHRWQIVNRIIEKGLEDRCLISLIEGPFLRLEECKGMKRHFPLWGYPRNIISNNLDDYDDSNIIEMRRDGFFNSVDKIPNSPNLWASRVIPTGIYDASWITIVGETNTNSKIFFPTEKVAKPMLDGRLFLAIGGKDYLKNLRKIGFETFHEYVDESYDSYENEVERVDKMINTLIMLSNENMNSLYQKIQPILIHNQMLMRNIHKMTRELRSFLLGFESGFRYQPKS